MMKKCISSLAVAGLFAATTVLAAPPSHIASQVHLFTGGTVPGAMAHLKVKEKGVQASFNPPNCPGNMPIPCGGSSSTIRNIAPTVKWAFAAEQETS